jgi:hypothetical protein
MTVVVGAIEYPEGMAYGTAREDKMASGQTTCAGDCERTQNVTDTSNHYIRTVYSEK